MLTKGWEFPDIRPTKQVNAVVGVSIGHLKDGSMGKALEPIVQGCADVLLDKTTRFAIFSGHFVQNKIALSELMKNELYRRVGTSASIIVPSVERNIRVHNTYTEAEFTIQTCKKNGWKSLLVIANHLHMRRCLAALRVVMEKENYQVVLYNKSVGQDSYGSNASVQNRFRYRSLFFCYEIFVALPVSIILGWWKL